MPTVRPCPPADSRKGCFAEMTELTWNELDAAAVETDPRKYAEQVKGFVKMAFDDVPRIPLFQESLDIATSRQVEGYTYWYHRQIDARPLSKAGQP